MKIANSMLCENCEYNEKSSIRTYNVCLITHAINPKYCYKEDVENNDVCFNCKHWIGGGDFGLSCSKYYHIATANGLRRACEDFDRRL